ncbi:MAG TPA: type II toxin-antitoxin system mRNA interferase toxin, RelE/StbE family [Elusimicrobia bacterium]|nr:type II toxin-antitoxin system mRNA interferase toxin, RelE/StbE family [Elusimicrobiota bacterium]
MYKVEIARTARRDLDRIMGPDLSRLEQHIIGLGTGPRPHGAKKLQDKLHRIRVGNWRVLYAVQDLERVVTILRVLRRNERTYRNL